MVKFHIACHACTWGELTNVHIAPVFRQIAEAGYEGVEGICCNTAEELVNVAAEAKAWGLQLIMPYAKTPDQIIRYNAAIGNKFCEIWEGFIEDLSRPGADHKDRFATAARYFEPYIRQAARYGLKLCHHIHLNQLVMTMEHVEMMLTAMPEMGILLDTGHLGATGGDALKLIDRYGNRIVNVHLKDFHRGEDWDLKKLDFNKKDYMPQKFDFSKSYFVPLGEGNSGIDVGAILKKLEDIGYEGWVSCELDMLPAFAEKGIPVSELIRRNREYLRSLGY